MHFYIKVQLFGSKELLQEDKNNSPFSCTLFSQLKIAESVKIFMEEMLKIDVIEDGWLCFVFGLYLK